jgi:hypothetical protein|tara:strand:- start:1527 stop:1799 length:273 start_codon:yes stop_codon:yes gene_type:complete
MATAVAVSVDNEKRRPKTEGPAVRTVLDHQTILSYEYVFKYDNVTVNTLIAYTESKHFVVADFFSRDSGGLQSFTIAPTRRPLSLERNRS